MGPGSAGLRVLLMSSVYFESINDWGSAQISDSFSNYVLWKKGEVYSGIGQAAATQMWDMRAPVPKSGARAIIAIELPPGCAPLTLFQKLDGNTQWARIYSSDVYTSNQKLAYYVFIPSDDPEVSLEPPRGLLNIWNEHGKLIYDSEAPFLKVLDYREHYYGAGQLSTTYPNAKKIGLVISQPQWYVDSGGSAGGGWGSLAGVSAYVTGNRVTFDYLLFRRTTSGNQWPSVTGGTNPSKPAMVKMLVCDLTKMDEVPLNL